MVQARFPKCIKYIATAVLVFALLAYTNYMQSRINYLVYPRKNTTPPEEIKLINTSQVWLEQEELQLIVKYLVGKFSYIEWGSGGSTLNFPKLVQTAASIEHDKTWCESMPQRITNADISNLVYKCIPTKQRQGTDGNYNEFQRYVDHVLHLDRKKWNFVFIDGRARVPCAIRILPFLEPSSIVAVHDFQRESYQHILEFYDIIEQIEGFQNDRFQHKGLVILKRKSRYHWIQNNHNEATKLIQQFDRT